MGSWLDERRLRRISVRLRTLRDELRLADEQALYLRDDADDLGVDAAIGVVGASADHRRATEHAAAMDTYRRHLVDSIAALEAEQDQLLDRMSARHG
jgi:3-deoxy-D-manno-octulosonate 8-phosphate phosphatase KdsC-like HAD superfamily phosphatase